MTARNVAVRLAAVVVALVVLAGCASTTPVQPVGEPSADRRPTATTGDGDLVERRRAAGIDDCPASDPEVAAHPEGLPDLTLDCLGGDSQVRLAGLRGEPMLINVWAQWCGPCRTEAPFLAEAAQARPDVQVLGIDFDDPEPAAAVDFAGQAGWGWPQVVDPDKRIAPEMRVIGPPQSFLVDAEGRIVHVHVGPFTSTEQVLETLDRHLPQ
ncbi:TlpA family protein disulfide reductase [Enemella sp. A6]|uniref:TlpA family protein disulfide reductase n=1 Tax=Enemella sp. A6 TaxID=3440152 RepID=UPI003EBBC893